MRPCRLACAAGAVLRRLRSSPGSRGEGGTVTAEAAVVLPTLVLFTAGMAWLVSLGVTQVRAVDAARETARTVARGETTGQAVAVGRRVATTASTISVSRGSRLVVVKVRSPVRGPGGLFGMLPAFDVSAEAVAVLEPET